MPPNSKVTRMRGRVYSARRYIKYLLCGGEGPILFQSRSDPVVEA